MNTIKSLRVILLIVLLAVFSNPSLYSKSDDSSTKKKRPKVIRILDKGVPPSVINKETFPPGVDKHNYVSYASYWWPNPNTADGLPYIRKDGVRNKKLVNQGDAGKFHKMAEAVILLTREYNKTGDEKFATKAAEYLKVWFINPETAMNPNLDNGQMIMGKNQGTKSGILELRYMISLVEVLPNLTKSSQWSDSDHRKLKDWFREYYKWMISSEIGMKAATKFQNNHGTWYDAQVTSIALFLGRKDFAKQIIENAKKRRIEKQIEPDGTQPMELERTRSMTYTLFNLQALFAVAAQADKVGVDLWSYETKDGRSIQKAYQYALQYKDNLDAWPTKQIDEVEQWRWDFLADKNILLQNITH